jgi:hypothetical protein
MCEDTLRIIKSRRLIDESREIIARADVLLERTSTLLTVNDAWLGRYFLLIVQLALI